MIGPYLQVAIIAFIVLGISVAIWKGGSSNPVGTGKIDRRVSSLIGKVDQIELQVVDIEERAASKEDIRRLEERMAAHDAKVDGMTKGLGDLQSMIAADSAKTDEIGRQVDRLYDEIVRKGMER